MNRSYLASASAAAVALVVSATLVGCSSSGGGGGSSAAATTPAAQKAPTEPVKAPAVKMPAAFKDATHTLTMDEPYFKSSPASGGSPEGTWKSGTQVLVMVPGAPYSKVKVGDGTEAYVKTASLKAMGQ
jgi:hypothetical protein